MKSNESNNSSRDKTNPNVTAVSAAPFRSLGVGNHLWLVTNDTECGPQASKDEFRVANLGNYLQYGNT